MFSFRMRQGRAESPAEAFSPGHRPGLDHYSMAVRPERAKAWPKRRGFFKYNGVGRAFALTGRKGMNSPKPRALPWAESNNWAFSPPIPCVLTRMLVESKMRTSNWTPYQTDTLTSKTTMSQRNHFCGHQYVKISFPHESLRSKKYGMDIVLPT